MTFKIACVCHIRGSFKAHLKLLSKEKNKKYEILPQPVCDSQNTFHLSTEKEEAQNEATPL